MGQGKSSKTVEHWIRERSKPIFHPLVGAGGMRKKTKKKKKRNQEQIVFLRKSVLLPF